MATKKSTSRIRPSRNQDASSIDAESHLPCEPVLKEEPALIEAVEEERHRLMKAEAVLDCVLVAMNDEPECIGEEDCEDDERIEGRRPHYPSILGLARDLVNQSIHQLDSVRLRPMIEQIKRRGDYPREAEKLGLGKSGKDEVKEAGTVTYLY